LPNLKSSGQAAGACDLTTSIPRMFEHNGMAAARALESLGKQLGMFKERCEFGIDRFSRMSVDELDAFIRAKLDNLKLIEGTCGSIEGDSGGA
jgi:hypothetical protein